MASLSPFFLLILAALPLSVLGWRLDKPARGGGRERALPLDLLWMMLLAIAGILQATHIHDQVNPNWYPVGQDWREFVVLGLDIQSGGAFHPVPQRYPFYAWVAVQLANVTQVPVHVALMQVNLIAGGLLPAALYRLGTAFTARPIAIAGGWLALHIPTVAATLGPPTDYLFHGLIHVLALSEGIRALRSRAPTAWLGFGVCLALLMAANMKSLVFLLGAAPLVTAALLWRARESPRSAALAGLLWLAPMITVWNVYSSTPRWTTEAYTLEYNVYRTQVVVARAHGRTAPLPTDLGWHPTDEKQRGYWGVGRAGAWSNLDKVLQFLTRGPQHNLDASVRFEGAVLGLTRALHLPAAACLLLGLMGCIAPLRRRASDTHLGPILATGWLVGITGAQFMGLMATHFIPRYALVLLIPAPLLILSAVGLGARRLGWLLPLSAVITTLVATGVPGVKAVHGAPEVQEAALNPHTDFWAVRDGLRTGDRVMDLTGNRILQDLWGTSPAQIWSVYDEETTVTLKPQSSGRRVLVMPGALNMGDPVRRWVGAEEGRLRQLRNYVFEDTQPETTLHLRLTGLGL